MNIELKQFKDLGYVDQLHVAVNVSNETKSQFGAEQKIVPIEPGDVFAKDIGLVALKNNVFIGYVAASKPDHDSFFAKVGSLVVPQKFQGSGVGKMLISSVTSKVVEQDFVPFAFCNQKSQSCFAETGYMEALPEELPPEFQSPFGNQPMIYPRMKLCYLLKEPLQDAVDLSAKPALMKIRARDDRRRVGS